LIQVASATDRKTIGSFDNESLRSPRFSQTFSLNLKSILKRKVVQL
jgi:hypothetical protein